MTIIEDTMAEKNSLLSLCYDYDIQFFAAEPIKTLTNLMNYYINQREDEDISKQEMKDITYQVTTLVSFLAFLHEKTRRIKHLERSHSQSQEV